MNKTRAIHISFKLHTSFFLIISLSFDTTSSSLIETSNGRCPHKSVFAWMAFLELRKFFFFLLGELCKASTGSLGSRNKNTFSPVSNSSTASTVAVLKGTSGSECSIGGRVGEHPRWMNDVFSNRVSCFFFIMLQQWKIWIGKWKIGTEKWKLGP